MPPPEPATAASSSDPKAAGDSSTNSGAPNGNNANAASSSSSPTRAADEDPLTCPLLVGDMVRVSEEYVPRLALPFGTEQPRGARLLCRVAHDLLTRTVLSPFRTQLHLL
jgi:hypothetical protein